MRPLPTRDTIKVGDAVKNRHYSDKYQNLTVTRIEPGCNGVIYVRDNTDGTISFFAIQDLSYR